MSRLHYLLPVTAVVLVFAIIVLAFAGVVIVGRVSVDSDMADLVNILKACLFVFLGIMVCAMAHLAITAVRVQHLVRSKVLPPPGQYLPF
jgi:uncharacterized metal-binding protein